LPQIDKAETVVKVQHIASDTRQGGAEKTKRILHLSIHVEVLLNMRTRKRKKIGKRRRTSRTDRGAYDLP